MKQLSKMMLAALAAIALAVPAYAWDFKASGSVSAQFANKTEKASSSADAVSSNAVTDSGGAISIVSSNTDGDNTVTLTYKIDYDGGLDEGFTVAGSTKVGDWTASGSTNQQKLNNGSPASAEDTTSITLTDGTMTIVLGDSSHLSSQNVSSESVASGSIDMDPGTGDYGPGAYVGGFQGVSLGYKVNDTTSVTVALQMTGDDNDTLGSTLSNQDGETATYGVSGNGVGLSTVAGPATIGVTIASASTSDPTGAGSLSTSTSTMGLGVKLEMGDIDPFLSYGTGSASGSTTDNKYEVTAMDLGFTFAMGSDSVVFNYGTMTQKTTTSGTAGEPDTWNGMEIGYTTAVGPATLGIGYGTLSKKQSGGSADGYSMSNLEVQLDYSF